ncbi:MAG: endonuclease NucS [Chromatiales bacterium]|nr:endonuclease NucS [Chromatiales bacterium]
MTEELRLWSVGESGEVEPLSPLQQMPTEMALEELLVRNPEMLGSGLKLVGRQTRTQSGWLDLLAVDQDGRLVVYELKRGTLARDAVTQVLDYASDLDAMSASALAAHIAERCGHDGIQEIDDFEQWYADNFGGDDLSPLLPPRMVLVGLGVDPAAERMAKFISGGPVDLSVVTFHGFTRGEEKVLARQLEVEPGPREPAQRRPSATVNERRRALREYLTDNGYEALFDRIHDEIRALLPERGVWEEPGRKGIGFQLTERDVRGGWKTYFGVQAGYRGPVYSVSILPQAIRWGESALERLRTSVQLHDWPHGGYVCDFQSEEKWAEHGGAVLEFVRVVMANRSDGGEVET